MSQEFDVFLAHNSVDKPLVRQIANQLRQRGLNPWLDEEQISPGQLFQVAIQAAIPFIKSAAICIGKDGLGKWQAMELHTLTNQFVDRGIPVIPVLLPEVKKLPEELLFLKQFNWVAFETIDAQDAFNRLEWGITGVKPSKVNFSPNKIDINPANKKDIYYIRLAALLENQKL